MRCRFRIVPGLPLALAMAIFALLLLTHRDAVGPLQQGTTFAATYSWVDKDGVTNFSNKPPRPGQDPAAASPKTPQKSGPAPQQAKPQSLDRPSVAGTGKIFMWKASSSENYIFLLGSVHAAKKSFYPLDKRIEDAFSSTAALAVEADAVGNQLEIQALTLREGLYPGNDTLDKNITQRTKDKLKQQGIDLAPLNKFKPWFAAITIQMQRTQRMGLDPNLGIDVHFLKKARAEKKEVRELESAEFQLKLMAELSEGKEDLFLYHTLLGLDGMEAKYNAIFDYWAQGDATRLESLIMAELDSPDFKSLGDKLFFERNVKMAEKVEGYLKEKKPVFVIVGAGHLVGDKGMVKLLQAKGYTLEQVGG